MRVPGEEGTPTCVWMTPSFRLGPRVRRLLSVGESGMEMYSAAKAGAAGFMRAVAKTLGRHLITANCVALAAMRTPTSRGTTEDEERAKQMLRSYTIRRFGEPDDAANMVLFLASDASSWITGQTYPVNGGYSFSM